MIIESRGWTPAYLDIVLETILIIGKYFCHWLQKVMVLGDVMLFLRWSIGSFLRWSIGLTDCLQPPT